MLWATRMICGYCGAEQNFSNKPCLCGAVLTKQSSSHWEGGKGCRDQAKMSKGDKKKHANSANKTKANAKVGQQAAAQRDAKKASRGT